MEKAQAKPTFRQDLREIFRFLKVFFKNPLRGMSSCPHPGWLSLIMFNLAVALLSGGLSGLISRNVLRLVVGVIVFPFSTLLLTLLAAGVFYYLFFFLYNKKVPFRRLYTILVISSLPFLALHIAAPLLPHLDLLGVALMGVLLVIGFTEEFRFPKMSTVKLVGGIYLVFFVAWGIRLMSTPSTNTAANEELTTPESLQILKEEFNR